MMDEHKLIEEFFSARAQNNTRRHFLKSCTSALGGVALGSLMSCGTKYDNLLNENSITEGIAHFAPKAKSVIYLHMAGSPSQLEMFEYKPELSKLHGQPCPESLLNGKKFAFIEGVPEMLGQQYKFSQKGVSGAYVSELLPHTGEVVDEISFLRAVHTDQFNHAPAQMLMQTGSPRLGRPSMGSWVTYGLGSENKDLPGFMVLVSGGKTPSAGKSIWGSGFLPTVYQGVQCRSEGDPVLYLNNPDGFSRNLRKKTIDAINQINQEEYEMAGDPEILTRISQYEMAYRMQISAPEIMDIDKEPEYIHEMYGTTQGKGSFANNCLLARRLVEKGVRFVQLYDWGWDSHGAAKSEALNGGFIEKCRETDQPIAALIKDLKQRGLLEETLVVWGGEFGRTPMRENRGGKTMEYIGRDHHTDAYTMWMAGGGIKKGHSFGETDELGYHAVNGKVHVHDIQATILNQLGINHEKLTYFFQGRDYRLTDLYGSVIKDIII